MLSLYHIIHEYLIFCNFTCSAACNCAMFKEGDDHQELVELIQSYQVRTVNCVG